MITSQVAQLDDILRANQTWDGRRFSDAEVKLLSRYYELTLKWNDRLHLTTLTQPQAFFERHILESALAESLILHGVKQVWDLGSGLGIPGMVMAILRHGLTVHLVEASRNKAVFLEAAVEALQLDNMKVVKCRFESLEDLPANSCLTARAVEEMEKWIPEIMRLGDRAAQILIFGSKHLEERVRVFLTGQRQMKSLLIPGSERRYLMNIVCST